jgi:hypothetical protein
MKLLIVEESTDVRHMIRSMVGRAWPTRFASAQTAPKL